NENPICVRWLLKDSSVKPNEPDNDGYTPLWHAARNGCLGVIKWWIASGREMDLGQPGNPFNDAIGGAKKRGKTGVASLLEAFKEDPEKTIHEVRIELGCLDDLAAEIFALTVFLCDGFIELKEDMSWTEAASFFRIMRELPTELQMILCYRVVDLEEENFS